MLKKVLIPAAAILTICFTPATLFAGNDITLTGSDLKGYVLDVESDLFLSEDKVISVED